MGTRFRDDKDLALFIIMECFMDVLRWLSVKIVFIVFDTFQLDMGKLFLSQTLTAGWRNKCAIN